MAQREFFNRDIVQHIQEILSSELENLKYRWREYSRDPGSDQPSTVTIYTDIQAQIPVVPAIEIIEGISDATQIAIGSQHEKCNFDLIVTVTNSSPEESKRYL